jgi:protein-S-isoprenylcysteine O-methyltransferase Ste14
MGFTQKETVKILYAICGILGLVAVFMCDKMFTENAIVRSIMITVLALVLFLLYVQILKNPESRVNTGLVDEQAVAEAENKKQAAAEENKENK